MSSNPPWGLFSPCMQFCASSFGGSSKIQQLAVALVCAVCTDLVQHTEGKN